MTAHPLARVVVYFGNLHTQLLFATWADSDDVGNCVAAFESILCSLTWHSHHQHYIGWWYTASTGEPNVPWDIAVAHLQAAEDALEPSSEEGFVGLYDDCDAVTAALYGGPIIEVLVGA